jgi:protein-L-isoaspartate(D-aspartate) O-methyltransferase
MAQIPRERFLPEPIRAYARLDEALPIGLGQTISQPTVVAIMTSALELTGTEKVLEVGTGSGYQTAVLCELAGEVFTIEVLEALSQRARAVLDTLGCENAHFRVGDGYLGWPEEAPFDRIICTAAPPQVPELLCEQLTSDGIMVVPVGVGDQELVRLRRRGKRYERENLGGVRFVPMIHGHKPS